MYIGEEVQYEKQVDRACAAQSPDMLPPRKEDLSKVYAARERVLQDKTSYQRTPKKADWN